MKIFSIAVAVSLVLACVHFLESSAFPFSEVQMEEIENSDSPVMAHEETADHSMDEPLNSDHSKDMGASLRVKRQSHMSLLLPPATCRYCFKCCKNNKGWGFCCSKF